MGKNQPGLHIAICYFIDFVLQNYRGHRTTGNTERVLWTKVDGIGVGQDCLQKYKSVIF